jgi:hypothetical protein
MLCYLPYSMVSILLCKAKFFQKTLLKAQNWNIHHVLLVRIQALPLILRPANKISICTAYTVYAVRLFFYNLPIFVMLNNINIFETGETKEKLKGETT